MEMCSGEDRRHKTPVQPSLSHYHYIPFPSIIHPNILQMKTSSDGRVDERKGEVIKYLIIH